MAWPNEPDLGGDISLLETWEWIPLIGHQSHVSGPTKDKTIPEEEAMMARLL